MWSKFTEHPVKAFAINLWAQVLIRTNPRKLSQCPGYVQNLYAQVLGDKSESYITAPFPPHTVKMSIDVVLRCFYDLIEMLILILPRVSHWAHGRILSTIRLSKIEYIDCYKIYIKEDVHVEFHSLDPWFF